MHVAIDIRRAADFGIGTYIRNIVNQLARLDGAARYLLIGRREDWNEFEPLPENFELFPYEADPGSFRAHFHLPIALQRRQVDLLHMPWFYAPAVVPCRLVMTVHDLMDLFSPPAGATPLVQAWRLFLARRAVAKASRILAVSQATKRELARAFAIPESKIEVIYNALDERFTREPLPDDANRILERHAVNYPFVLYAGNIKPQKNLARLIEAFAVAKADLRGDPSLSRLKLLVIGDELAKHADLRRAVVRTRLREDVRFLGFVPYPVLRVFYARARAFLFPSLYEGFGLPPLEAMAHGTPVLTSNVSSLPEVFGQAALLVNPENVFEIARGIRQILTEHVLREALTRRGHELVERYSWERSARQLRAVYEAVCGTRAAAA
ncbi:MAG TPA: glycosyltransferase family 1 protein [Candidatus Acidoferrales bacterium]|jgi:glycosyltransferase involved in cell wall biosynthesis|nr:glycosyltransferase family 1 protein [Candidatus Acidoferrales bacterium]